MLLKFMKKQCIGLIHRHATNSHITAEISVSYGGEYEDDVFWDVAP
jgi:hypothetical protein